jgi:hypothetical protein
MKDYEKYFDAAGGEITSQLDIEAVNARLAEIEAEKRILCRLLISDESSLAQRVYSGLLRLKAPASDINIEVETDPLAGVEDDIKPVVKQLGNAGSAVTNFNRKTGTMDFVRGTQHFSVQADELKALLSHLYDLRDDIYEVCNARYEAKHRQFYGKYQ